MRPWLLFLLLPSKGGGGRAVFAYNINPEIDDSTINNINNKHNANSGNNTIVNKHIIINNHANALI